MSSVNWGLYDSSDLNSKPVKPEPLPSALSNDVNWGLYDNTTAQESHPFFGQYKQYTQAQYEALSPEKKKELQEYFPAEGIIKSALKGLTFGASEKYPAILGMAGSFLGDKLKLKDFEKSVPGTSTAEFVGETAPLSKTIKALQIPLEAIPKVYKWGRRIYQTGASTALGGGVEATKEAIRGEDLNPIKIAISAAAFGALDLALRGVVGGYKWLKGLSPKQQSELLVDSVIPEDLSPTQYKFYEEKIVPELQKVAEADYQKGLEKATQEVNAAFEQKMANVRAEHESKLLELEQQQQLNQQTEAQAVEAYQNKLRQTAAEHQAKLAEIEEANTQAMQKYEEQVLEWEQAKKRQAQVENAIEGVDRSKTSKAEVSLPEPTTPLKERVESTISNQPVENLTTTGKKAINAVNASSKADYELVQELYKVSDELNAGVESTHEALANELRYISEEISAIPEPSGHQKAVKDVADKVLDAIIQFDAQGNAVGLKTISNDVLLNQAKAVRQMMRYDFAEGNPSGVMTPLLDALEEAALEASVSTGNAEAASALKKAQGEFKGWSDLYRNKHIKKYRQIGNHEYKKTLESSLNVDDFVQLDKVLSRTNAGQQLSSQIRRELVTKELQPFIKNPQNIDPEKFNKVIKELEPVLKPGEEASLRIAFKQAAKKLVPAPVKPELKTIESVKIPTVAPNKAKPVEMPSKVKIPTKPSVKPTPEMNEAAKRMKITPEEAINLSNSPTGLKKLKTQLSKRPGGDQLFRELGKKKIKEILYEGKVRRDFSGDELVKIINKGENFDILSSILGEEETLALLDSAEAIGAKKASEDSVKRFIKNVATFKTLKIFGIF